MRTGIIHDSTTSLTRPNSSRTAAVSSPRRRLASGLLRTIRSRLSNRIRAHNNPLSRLTSALMNRAGVIRTNSNANSNRRNLAAAHDSDDEDDHPQQREGGVQNSTVSPSISPPRRLRIQRPTTNLDSSDSDENEGNISIVSNAYSESVRNRTMTSISHTDSEGTSSLSPSNMTDTNSDTASTHSELDLAIVQTLNINLQLLIYSTVLEDLKRLGVWIKGVVSNTRDSSTSVNNFNSATFTERLQYYLSSHNNSRNLPV